MVLQVQYVSFHSPNISFPSDDISKSDDDNDSAFDSMSFVSVLIPACSPFSLMTTGLQRLRYDLVFTNMSKKMVVRTIDTKKAVCSAFCFLALLYYVKLIHLFSLEYLLPNDEVSCTTRKLACTFDSLQFALERKSKID
jgi:hypothetical protein